MLPRRRTGESGAAAVEFALVSVVLVPLLMGIMQYGLLFNDYLQVRQGVRQGARQGVVQLPATCGGASNLGAKIKCSTKDQISPVTGAVAVRVVTPTSWTKGQPLLVCAVVHSAAQGGLIPMPNDAYVKAKTQMSIETSLPAGTGFPSSDVDPTGSNWSWCS
jgi:hypothetical protein